MSLPESESEPASDQPQPADKSPSPEALNQLIERGTAALVRSGATAADLAALPTEFQEMIDAFPDRAHRIAAAALVRSGATPEAIALLPPELQRTLQEIQRRERNRRQQDQGHPR